jgi:hypothetical protein
MIISGTTYTFSSVMGVASTTNPTNNYYGIFATCLSPTASIVVNLYGSATPADGSTFTINAMGGAGTSNPILSADGKTYTPTSGTITCNIVDGKVRITFTNMQFKNMSDANDVVLVSAMATVL